MIDVVTFAPATLGTKTLALLSLVLIVAPGCRPEGGPIGGGGGAGGGGLLPETQFAVEILQPNGSQAVLAETELTLEATFRFAGRKVQASWVSWSSSSHGFLGSSNPLPDVQLGVGEHRVSVRGAFGGEIADAELTVRVGEIGVRILRPTSFAIAQWGEPVAFQGQASVFDDAGELVDLITGPGVGRAARFTWESSLDGDMGETAIFERADLSVGRHLLTLTVVDDGPQGTGLEGEASLEVVVIEGNRSPLAVVTSPPECPFELEQTASLTLHAAVIDPDAEDNLLTGSWRDTFTGATTAGNSHTLAAGAPLGKHQLNFEIVDHGGVHASASCDVWVISEGGDTSELFEDTGVLEESLPGGSSDILFIGGGDGSVLVGNDSGLMVVPDGEAGIATYDGVALGLSVGAVAISHAMVAGAHAWVATSEGLAMCAWTPGNGLLSACQLLRPGIFDALSSTPVGADTLLAGTLDGELYLARVSDAGSVIAERLFGESELEMPAVPQPVLFAGAALYVATSDGLCHLGDPLQALYGAPDAVACDGESSEEGETSMEEQVRALSYDAPHLWMATASGLKRIDLSNGLVAEFEDAADREIKAVQVDGHGVVWGLSSTGLARLDPATGMLTDFDLRDLGLAAEVELTALYVDEHATKWIGTESGMVRFTGQ